MQSVVAGRMGGLVTSSWALVPPCYVTLKVQKCTIVLLETCLCAHSYHNREQTCGVCATTFGEVCVRNPATERHGSATESPDHSLGNCSR